MAGPVSLVLRVLRRWAGGRFEWARAGSLFLAMAGGLLGFILGDVRGAIVGAIAGGVVGFLLGWAVDRRS